MCSSSRTQRVTEISNSIREDLVFCRETYVYIYIYIYTYLFLTSRFTRQVTAEHDRIADF